MADLARNLDNVKMRINRYCAQYHRPAGSVLLVAVGKKHPAERIAKLAAAGQRDFGENYLQEAQQKMATLRAEATGLEDRLRWHFIGHIQSRKCTDIARSFDWVHTVDSKKVADRLSRSRDGDPLNVLLQVNIDDESSKSGIAPDALPGLAESVAALPNLALRGLMIIPRPETELTRQRATFARCRELLESLNARGMQLDQLSMGMTGDMEAAIAEGATMVRIGTALFGQRPSN